VTDPSEHRPLRVAVESLNALNGGCIIVTQNLVREMALKRPQHHFLSYYSVPQVEDFEYPDNVELVFVPEGKSMRRRTMWQQRKFPGILQETRSDVLLCLSGFSVFGSDIPQVAVWQNPNPIARVKVPRPMKTHVYIALQRFGQRVSMPRATRNVFLTHDSVEMAKSWWSLEGWPHRVIHSGIDQIRVQGDIPSDDEREHFALSVGYTYYHKNYENMIDAMGVYRERYNDGLKLKIIGGPETRRPEYYDVILRRIRDKGLEDTIEMLGARTADEVGEYYRRAKVYFVTSLLETFGLTTLEAMSNGTPVLVPDATCFPEVCDEAAHYCDPLDPEDIATQLRRVVEDKELRARLKAKGLERIDYFSWDRAADLYLEEVEGAWRDGRGENGRAKAR